MASLLFSAITAFVLIYFFPPEIWAAFLFGVFFHYVAGLLDVIDASRYSKR